MTSQQIKNAVDTFGWANIRFATKFANEGDSAATIAKTLGIRVEDAEFCIAAGRAWQKSYAASQRFVGSFDM